MKNGQHYENETLKSLDVIKAITKWKQSEVYYHDADHFSALLANNETFKQKACMKCPDFGYWFDHSNEKVSSPWMKSRL